MSNYSEYHDRARNKARRIAVLILLKLNYKFSDSDGFPYHSLNAGNELELSLWIMKTAPKCSVFAYDPGATQASGGYYINTAFYCAYIDGFTSKEQTFLKNNHYQLYAELHDLKIEAVQAQNSIFFTSSKHKKIYQHQEEIIQKFVNN